MHSPPALDPSSLDLEGKIGQLLGIGFPAGPGGLATLEAVIKKTRAGNLILFSRNAGSPAELHALVSEARGIVESATGGVPPLIAVDQEGGVVTRLRRGMTPIPGAMAQGAAVSSGQVGLADIRELGRICGSELRAFGINWNLAPVADVNVNPQNPVIGVRSYGENPESVAELAAAFAAGLGDAGIVATAKHFPGHGDTAMDSHLHLPLVPHSIERLEAVELLPFRRLIERGIPVVMTAHVRFPAIEPDALPATLSSRVVEGLLRARLGFRGLVVSDCLEMKAIADNFEDAAARAIKAGVDLVFVSHDADAQNAAFESILRAVRKGDISRSRIDEAVSRIAQVKAGLPLPMSWAEAESLLGGERAFSLASRVSRASLSLLVPGPGLPPAPGSIYLDVGAAAASGAEDGGADASVASLLAASGGELLSHSLGVDPSETEIDAAIAAAGLALEGPRAGVILGLYAPGSHLGQLELLRRVSALAASRARPLGIVSMRSPYDTALLESVARESGSPRPAQLCAYEYSALSAASVAAFLGGSIRAEGRLPTGAHPRSDIV